MIIGIDPGNTGAIVEYHSDSHIIMHDMPVTPKLSGKGLKVNEDLLCNLFDSIGPTEVYCAFVEQVNAMPPGGGRSAGATSMFGFGEGFGIIKGCLAGLGIRREYVVPATWKKQFGLLKRDKDAARTYALQRFPSVVKELARKKDIGRADALLIASYGYDKLLGEIM